MALRNLGRNVSSISTSTWLPNCASKEVDNGEVLTQGLMFWGQVNNDVQVAARLGFIAGD